MKSKRIVVHLSGGLGNQLFQITTGMALAKSVNKNLAINSNLYSNPILREKINPNYKKKRKFEAIDFLEVARLPRDKFPTPINGRFEKYLENLSEIQKRKLGIATESSFSESGWSNPEKIRRLVGHFISPKYFSNIDSTSLFKELNLPLSPWSNLILKEIQHRETIGIHVRLGDYLFQNNIIVPNENYYLNALEYLQNLLGYKSNILIFSDEPNKIKNKFPKLYQKAKTLHPEGRVSVAENLFLLSKCTAFVCSNSTFSWWAANLSKVQTNLIVAPREFFVSNKKTNFNKELWWGNSLLIDP
jgi:hypothetical protein